MEESTTDCNGDSDLFSSEDSDTKYVQVGLELADFTGVVENFRKVEVEKWKRPKQEELRLAI